MQFLVDVTLLDRDDAAHRVRLGLSGRDTRGKGGAEGTVDSVLAAAGTGTRVAMATDLRFSGQVAQLGRPGVVQDVSNKLVDQFAECIKAQLSASPEAAAAAVVEAQKPVSGFSLAIAALVSAIKRLFGRGHGRERRGIGVKRITVTVNGVRHEREVEERELLVHFLREGLGLTGTNDRLRHLLVRHVHGPPGRPVGEVVHPARRPGRRRGGHHHRGPRHQRRRCTRCRPSFQEHHGLQCGYCTPGDDHGGGRAPRGEPAAPARRRSGTAWRATSAAAPATRTSSRPSRPWPDPRRPRWRPPKARPPSSGSRSSARRTPSSSRAARGTWTTSRSRGCSGSHVVRSPFAHARINGVDVSRALAMEGCVAAFSGADLADEWAAPLVCAWPVTDDIKMSEHWPLAKDKARYVGDGVAVVVATSRVLAKDAAELVEVDWEPLPAVTDPLEAMEDGAPLVHDDFGTNVSSVWGFAKGDSPAPFNVLEAVLRRPGPREGEAPLPAAPPDPQRHGAARRPGRAQRGDGRVHDVHREPDPAHRAHRPGDHLRHPGGQAARGRAGRGRRLRLEARRVRRGVDLPRARPPAEPPDQVDRGALGGLRRPRSTGATSTPTWRWPRPATAWSRPCAPRSTARWAPTTRS